MQLRDYQKEMLDRLERAWASNRSVMVQMPTGTGKTVLMAEAVRGCDKVLIVAHRRELIEQIRQTVRAFGLGEGIVVESIQKINSKEFEFDFEPELVIVDEAHHALAKTYRMLWERWPEAKFLGLTATPCRLSGEGFEDLFDVLLQSHDIQWFINEGWLSDFEYVSARPDSLMMHRIGQLQKRGADGDYQTKEMATVMDVPESVAHLYESYEAFAQGKKGIVYAIDRQHAGHIAAYYQAHGVNCAVIDAKTKAKERDDIVRAYKNALVDVIVNVDIFSEGFDCPEVEFIQLARPTLSLTKYLQQVGRGMRVSAGKDCVLILDNVGLYQTFGLPTDARDWRLMFDGKLAGKGVAGEEKPIVIEEPTDETIHTTKRLVNLEMVRIKRRGEKHQGLEIFMLGGKYGVMMDGFITCPAEFEHVKRLEAPYFAIGYYPYYIYKNKVTVIDRQGRDLKPGLYGKVSQEGDVFIGQNVRGERVYWDAKGGRQYETMPQFGSIYRFEVARTGEQIYMRNRSGEWDKPFSEKSVYLHNQYTILGNTLVFNNDIRKGYQICGYERDCIYINIEKQHSVNYKYAYVGRSGTIVSYTTYLPDDLRPYPDLRSLDLKRMKGTG